MSMILPTLYKLTSTGKVQMWEIETRLGDPKASFGAGHPVGDVAQIITRYGQKDGKIQIASELISEGKNIGKANETSPFEQAEAEAQSQWEKKIKKGYVQNIEDAQAKRVDTNLITGGVDPMLAHSYDKQGHKITFPAYAQAKLDGHRCIAIYQDGVCTLWSRTRKPITGVPHIARAIEAALVDIDFDEPIILDGELYNHDYRDKFEELTSFIRQDTPKAGHEVVQYWVYDIVVEAVQSTRDGMLGLLKQKFDGRTLMTNDSYLIDTRDEVDGMLASALELGFEGIMLRNVNGKYVGKRSYDLQKVKVFADAEYEVVAVEEGKGKMAGHAMFVCTTDSGKTFRVKMMGAMDDLKEMYENKDQYLGKMLTVKYQKFSAEGMPIFPVAMRFREEV